MKRMAMGFALVLGLYGLAQADEVSVKDPNKKLGKDVVGEIIDETPSGITIKEKGKSTPTIIAAGDVQAVAYEMKSIPKADFRIPEQKEVDGLLEKKDAKKRKDLLEESLSGFQSLETKIGESHPRAKRYVVFRIARLQAYLAQENKDDKVMRQKAIDGLIAYRKAYPDGWEILQVLLMLAKMQQEDNKIAEAAETLELIIALPDLPPDIRQKNTLLVAEMFYTAKQYDKAEKKLELAIEKLAPGTPERTKLQVYLVKSQLAQKKLETSEKTLNEVIRGNQEAELRAMAYNLLGDYYRARGDDERAFWSYLRVHVMYRGTPEEEAKALYYLWKLFPKVNGGDPARARECYDSLMDPKYAATEYGGIAAKEPKPEK
jgi:hypothetical protein